MGNHDILKERSEAIRYLSQSLKKGELVLFLGAGTSKGFGLPDWVELINLLRDGVSQPRVLKNASSEELQRAANEIESALDNDQTKLISLVAKHLYTSPSKNAIEAIKNPLLVAISALLMGSKGGRVSRVITLNYDDMLEWFLSLFGFDVKTVYQLPELEGGEDVRIYHPNGFVPVSSLKKKSNFLILSRTSVNLRNGTTYDSWKELVRHILLSGVCLFIGLSANSLVDRGNEALFSYCAEILKKDRPTGFWLSLDFIEKSTLSDFDTNNIIPIYTPTTEEMCMFILEICQNARKKVDYMTI